MTIYYDIKREGFEDGIGRELTNAEWDLVLRDVDKFIENAEPTQEELDDFVVQLASEY